MAEVKKKHKKHGEIDVLQQVFSISLLQLFTFQLLYTPFLKPFQNSKQS